MYIVCIYVHVYLYTYTYTYKYVCSTGYSGNLTAQGKSWAQKPARANRATRLPLVS